MGGRKKISDTKMKELEEKAKLIHDNFPYFKKLDLAGWKWEFIKRTDEYTRAYQIIKKILADAAPANDVELVKVLHTKEMRSFGTLLKRKFNIEIDYYILREHHFPYSDIEKDIMNDFLLIPNPALKYTELGQAASQLEIVRGALLDTEKIKAWNKGDKEEFGEYCIEFLTEDLAPVSFRDTVYIGISLATTRTEAVRAVKNMLIRYPFSEDLKKGEKHWPYNLLAYDLFKENYETAEIEQILAEAFPDKFSEIKNVYNCLRRGKELIQDGEYRMYFFPKES